MPYIKEESREALDNDWSGPSSPGELNFKLTTVIRKYWDSNPNYQGINDIIGALEGAKMEFYRRVAVPYEDTKINENGDVY